MFNDMGYSIIEPWYGLMCHTVKCPFVNWIVGWLMTCGMEPMCGDRGSGIKLTWT